MASSTRSRSHFFGIIAASIIGFIVGIREAFHNWLISKLAQAYVEIFRNIPPLSRHLFWYKGVISVCRRARESLELPLGSYLNNRGFFFPKPLWGDGIWLVPAALLVAIVISVFIYRWAKARQERTGQQFRTGITLTLLIIGLPLATFLAIGAPLTFDYPIADASTFRWRRRRA